MHWYWFQTFTIRSSLASLVPTRKRERRSRHTSDSSRKAASTLVSESNLERSAVARALLITPGADHFSASGFST